MNNNKYLFFQKLRLKMRPQKKLRPQKLNLSVKNTSEALLELGRYKDELNTLCTMIEKNRGQIKGDSNALDNIKDLIIDKLENIDELMYRLNREDWTALEDANHYIRENKGRQNKAAEIKKAILICLTLNDMNKKN